MACDTMGVQKGPDLHLKKLNGLRAETFRRLLLAKGWRGRQREAQQNRCIQDQGLPTHESLKKVTLRNGIKLAPRTQGFWLIADFGVRRLDGAFPACGLTQAVMKRCNALPWTIK